MDRFDIPYSRLDHQEANLPKDCVDLITAHVHHLWLAEWRKKVATINQEYHALFATSYYYPSFSQHPNVECTYVVYCGEHKDPDDVDPEYRSRLFNYRRSDTVWSPPHILRPMEGRELSYCLPKNY